VNKQWLKSAIMVVFSDLRVQTISLYINFLDCVLSVEDFGDNVLHSSEITYQYVR